MSKSIFHLGRRVQDAIMVSLISVLIWLYAEGANVLLYPEDDAMTVPLLVELGSRDLVVVEQSVDKVAVQFRGAQVEIDRLSRELPDGLKLKLDLAEPGRKTLSLLELVPRADPLNDIHVSPVKVDPATVTIAVDRLVTKDAELVFAPTDVRLVAGSLAKLPAVKITLPAQQLTSVADATGQIKLRIEPAVDLKTLAPGVEHKMQGRVMLPAALVSNPHVGIKPAVVDMAFTIDQRDAVHVIPSVPVWVYAPPKELEGASVQLREEDRVLRDVKVTGPAEVVEQIRAGKLPVTARLRLSADDLAKAIKQETSAGVVFDVPPGISVQSSTTVVRFTVVRPGR